MNEALADIQKRLTSIITQMRSAVSSDEPFGNAHGNWSFPGLTRSELIEEAQSIIDDINDFGVNDLGENEAIIKDYSRRLQHLEQQTIPNIWGNANQAVPAYLFTLYGLKNALAPILKRDASAENRDKLRKLTGQVRGMEARLNGLEPRTNTLNDMVERIEKAYNAADQLPADLESLEEARKKIENSVELSLKFQSNSENINKKIESIKERMEKINTEAAAVLKNCQTAYAASTSVGLAAAFSERSVSLSRSMWFWIGGLIIALMAGSFLGSGQLKALSELLKIPDASVAVVTLNLLLSIISVGAPIWFAWLATKQIGQRFRLSEDYAFKASIARAYEGFRREAARFDKDMEAKLLNSALTRLDELPLRLVETTTHGSPWHELASSDAVKQAMNMVPAFSEQVKGLAERSLDTLKIVRGKAKPSAAPTE